MKKIIFALPFLIACSINIYSQWSTDPNNNLIVGYGLDPHICSDSAGGCYITYDYENIYYPRKLALERLNKYGYKSWGTLKQILGELPEQSHAQIIEDGEGGVIVSYEDRFEDLPITAQRVKVQRVDSSGNFLWGPTGVRVTLDEINHGAQRIVNDGEGGAVVVWINTLDQYIVNRISGEGQRMWGDSGIVLGVNGYRDPAIIVRTTNNKYVASSERNTYKYFDENGNVFYTSSVIWLENIISDGYGGIIISSRGGQWPQNWQLRAQRENSLGISLWQEPHIIVAESLYTNTINKIICNDGLYFFSWTGKKDGVELVAQFQVLRPDGTKLFNQGSLSISNYPVDALIGNILPSYSGTFLAIWQDYRPDDGVFGQRRDTLGNSLWNSNDVLLYKGMYSDLFAITDGRGGAIGLGWHQFDFSIRAFKVSKNGILGEIITHVSQEYQEIFPLETILYQNYPNPFNPSTLIKYGIPKAGLVTIKVYDILGSEVATLVNEEKSIGRYEINFDASALASGVYIYQLSVNDFISSKKMILIK